MHVDHVIPYFVFTFKRKGGKLIRSFDVNNAEFKKLWHIDNLELVDGKANQSKGCKLPPEDRLANLKHCWPTWFNGQLPTPEDREFMHAENGRFVE